MLVRSHQLDLWQRAIDYAPDRLLFYRTALRKQAMLVGVDAPQPQVHSAGCSIK